MPKLTFSDQSIQDQLFVIDTLDDHTSIGQVIVVIQKQEFSLQIHDNIHAYLLRNSTL